MAKIPKEGKILGKVAKNDLPTGLVSVVYFCSNCGGKHTYGADFFTDVGAPATCPNCSTPFDQDDQVQRYDDEDDDKIRMKRDDLHRKRGEAVPKSIKPDDPEKIKAQRIKDLEREIVQLKGDQE
jgi:DNA-directed RNA polymerase subunit RPC12/RpoP